VAVSIEAVQVDLLRRRLKGRMEAWLGQLELEALGDPSVDGARVCVKDGGDILRAMAEPLDREGGVVLR